MHSCEINNLKKICPHCGKEHNADFVSDFDFHTHYLITKCANCGYKIFIRDTEITSGIEQTQCDIKTDEIENNTVINDDNCDISDKFKL